MDKEALYNQLDEKCDAALAELEREGALSDATTHNLVAMVKNATARCRESLVAENLVCAELADTAKTSSRLATALTSHRKMLEKIGQMDGIAGRGNREAALAARSFLDQNPV